MIKENIEKKINDDKEAKERIEQHSSGNPTHQNIPIIAVAAGEQNYWISTFSNIMWNIAPVVLFASFLYIVQLVLKSS